jgi:CBS domain-containing protein
VTSINIVQHFENVQLSGMRLSSLVVVPSGRKVRSVVAAMAAQHTGCAVVTDGARLAGIFTERDIAKRVVRSPETWDAPVDRFMTAEPKVIGHHASAIEALRTMNARRFRNLPVTGADGELLGSINHYELIRLAASFLGSPSKLGPELSPEHNLHFVDLTGLPARDPLLVRPDDSLAAAIGAMLTAETGLVSVVSDRGAVIGELTEHDVFLKVACRVENLEAEAVGDWMTTEIAAATPGASISEALRIMADLGHRYLVLISETGRALGVVTFREITEYFEIVCAA